MPPRSDTWSPRITTPWVWLAGITHPLLEAPIRVAVDSEDVTFGGEVYAKGSMGLVAPNFAEGDQQATVRIANIDRRAGLAIMQMITPPEITFSMVNADDPDTGASTWNPMVLAQATGNAIEITGEFRSRVSQQDPFPKDRATKENAPGLWV